MSDLARLELEASMEHRWSKDEARVMLNAWRESGLSVEAFAQQRQLKPKRIYRWRRKLEEPRRASGVAATVLLPVEMPRTVSCEPIAVMVRGGCVVKVGRGFDEEVFARVVAVLEGA